MEMELGWFHGIKDIMNEDKKQDRYKKAAMWDFKFDSNERVQSYFTLCDLPSLPDVWDAIIIELNYSAGQNLSGVMEMDSNFPKCKCQRIYDFELYIIWLCSTFLFKFQVIEFDSLLT